MDIGMLWYDDNVKQSLTERVGRAVAHYRAKYGKLPNTCYVNPSALVEGREQTANGVRLRPARTVLPNHFWLGISEN